MCGELHKEWAVEKTQAAGSLSLPLLLVTDMACPSGLRHLEDRGLSGQAPCLPSQENDIL